MAKKSKTKKVFTTDLEPAFPASPGRPPKYGFYIYKRNKKGNPCNDGYYNFHAKYAAKHFIELLLDGATFEWIDEVGEILKGSGETIETSTGIIIDGRGLEEIIEYEYANDLERGWVYPHGSDIVHLRAAKYIDDEQVQELKENAKPVDDNPKEKPPKVKKEKKPKIDKTGLVTVKDIAADLGCSPSDARSALRKAKIEKPEAGWCWPESEVEGIKKIIKKGLK